MTQLIDEPVKDHTSKDSVPLPGVSTSTEWLKFLAGGENALRQTKN